MKAARVSFMQMMLFIRRDMMLFASCAAPLLAGVFFRFAVPVMERALVSWTGRTEVLAPYYGLFDLIFSMLAPIMFCFVTAMVVLEEHDDHIENYLFITTLGRKGYLISRIFLPVVICLLYTSIGLSGLSKADHYRAGMLIEKTANQLGRHTVVIASGDLSHRLKEDGPYGYREEGPAYDQRIMETMEMCIRDRLKSL